jgi:hypothetical protein
MLFCGYLYALNDLSFTIKNIKHLWATGQYDYSFLFFIQGIYSHVTCPGLVMTNLTDGILPSWFWHIIMPFFLLVSIVRMDCVEAILSEAP